jgi:hypothetical protein
MSSIPFLIALYALFEFRDFKVAFGNAPSRKEAITNWRGRAR